MRYFTDSAILLLYSMLAFFYVPADQALVFSLLFTVILGCVTYLCRASETESWSHNSLPVLKRFDNRILVLTGSYVIFGFSSLWIPDLLLFFPLLLYQTLSAGLFPLAVVEFPFWGLLAFRFHKFPEFLCLAGIFGFILAFFLWSHTRQYEILTRNFRQSRDDSEEHALLLSEKNKALLEKQDYEIYNATLKERNRIAREIHDNVGHVLSRSILMVGAAKIINKDPGMTAMLKNLEDSLNHAMNSIRNSVHDLHDEAVNLEEVEKSLVREFTFCSVQMVYDMTREVPREVKYCFISITKEAFANIMKHSNATKVQLILREHPGLYQLCIEDNGTDAFYDPEKSGIGIANMKERVNALGGTLQIFTDKGFRIFITIPKCG